MLINAKGLGCPKPVIMAEEELAKTAEGIVEVLVDNEAAVKNLTKFANQNGFYSESSKEDKCWHVRIVKGNPCEMQVEKTDLNEAAYELFLIVGSDTMGKDEGLGKTLIKGFFETMKLYKQTPDAIFFLNAGVRLTTTNEDIFPILKDIEAMGVEILSCGTCLKHYNLESELKVGYRGTSNHIIEGIKDYKKVVWIG